MAPTPRLCVLKREESENFGFHLRVEKGLQGHVIRQVAQWGVAERNGVRDGDRLLEVNESFVDHVGHIEVRERMVKPVPVEDRRSYEAMTDASLQSTVKPITTPPLAHP